MFYSAMPVRRFLLKDAGAEKTIDQVKVLVFGEWPGLALAIKYLLRYGVHFR